MIGGVARMSDPKMIRDIIKAVSIPVMAKVRIGHFVEAQVTNGKTNVKNDTFPPFPLPLSSPVSTRSPILNQTSKANGIFAP